MRNKALLLAITLAAVVGQASLAEAWSPPAPPRIPPSIARAYPEDADGNGVADAVEAKAHAAQARLKAAVAPEERASAEANAAQTIEVQLVFTAPVTQKQIDDFQAAGGEIVYMYEAVSYGWNGRIALDKLAALPALMGKAFVLVTETQPAVLHLDMATRTGRVRPVWASGFAGNASGFDGDSTITIAIVDTGVDSSHTDLAGRQQYWHDFTPDGNGSPLDMGEHGSHVTGIALGTGASAGAATGTLNCTDSGDLSTVPSGSFYPAPLDLPTTSMTYSSTARWLGGGSTSLYQLYHTKGTAGGWTGISTATAGTSPITESNTLTGLATRAYCPGLLSIGGTVKQYVVTSTIPNYPAGGDGFNKLRGVAPGCQWAGAKVFTNAGSGLMNYVDSALDTLVANRVANNIKVLNMSLGVIGDPGIYTSTRQKVNTAVNNGIVVCCSAGNDGGSSTQAQRQVDDPGRAAMAITVAASDDNNQLTDYSSEGFTNPSSTSGIEEDYKPDIVAPGGSAGYYTSILSVDSNSTDYEGSFADQQANDYSNLQGTSMASPFTAGCAALVIDAMQQQGVTWSFASSQHARQVKMVLCATATETNANRDSGAQNPTLQRATAPGNGYPVTKDMYEGYGMLNADAAIEAVTLTYVQGAAASIALGPTVTDRRAWARKVNLYAGWAFNPSLAMPAGGDFDMYLYSNTPATYGTPTLLASSTNAGNGAAESLNYTPGSNMVALLVVKRVAGSGTATLSSTGDSTGPSVAISAPSTTATKSGPVTYTVTYSDSQSGIAAITLAAGNITLNTTGTANGSIGVSGSGNTRTVTISSITGDGTLGISIAAGTATDNVGNAASAAGPSTTFAVDNTAPTVSISAPSTTLTNTGPVTYTVTYADAGSGIASITLATGNITLNKTGTANGTVGVSGSGSTRTVTISGITGDGTLGISIAAGTATDYVGNAAPAAGPSATFAVDNTAPTISIGAPSATLTAGGPVTYTITYGDAGSGLAAITLAAGNITLNKTGTANGTVGVSGSGSTRTVTISSITGDGTLGISIAAGTATDNAGNAAPGAGPSTTFNVDNTAPSIAINAPSSALTTGGPVTYTVTYSDAGSGLASITLAPGDITLNKTGTANGSVGVSGSGNTRTVTISSITGDGTLGISIAAGTATDNASNAAPGAGPSATFNVDNTAPSVSIDPPSASTTNTGPVTYTVTYDDSGSGLATITLATGNITLNKTGTADGTVGVSGSGNTRTVTISSITGDGTLGISIAAGTATDDAGNAAAAAGPSSTFAVDNTAPMISIGAPSSAPTNNGPITYTVTYDDSGSGIAGITLAAGDITLDKTGTANGSVGVSGTGNTRTVTISSITGDGTLGISIAAGTATDNADNAAASAGPSATFSVDNTAPTVTIDPPSAMLTNSGPVTYSVTYDDSGSGIAAITLAAGDIILNKTGTADGSVTVSGTGNTRTVTISSITGDGTLGISIASGTATDNAGNSAPVSGPSTTFAVDNTPPSVSLSAPSAPTAGSGPVTYVVTYGDTGSGILAITLAAGDITLNKTGTADGSVAVSGTGNTRTVTISSISGDGTLGISIAAGTATDNAGNTAPAAGPSDTFSVDNAPPSIDIGPPSATIAKAGPISYTVTYTDTGSGISTITLASDDITLDKTGTADGSVAISGTGNTRTVTISGITGDGTLGISVALDSASDYAGNAAPAAGPSATFLVDSTGPSGSVTIDGGADWTNTENVSLALAYNDGSGTGVVEMRFSDDDASWSAWEAVGSSKAWTLATGDGTKSVYVQFKDAVDNISVDTITAQIGLDTTPPTGTLAIDGGAAWTNSLDVALSLNASDGVGSGVARMRFSNDGLTWSPSDWASAPAYALSYPNWTLNAGDGTKTVYVQYEDAVGNVSTETVSDDIGLDQTPPAVQSIVLSGTPAPNAATVDFEVIFTEDVDPVAMADFSAATSGTVVTPPAVTGVTGSGAGWTVTVQTGAMEGTLGLLLEDLDHTIKDVVGNSLTGGGDSGLVHTVDTLPPHIANIVPVNPGYWPALAGPTNDSAVDFSVTFDESVASFDSSAITLFGAGAGTVQTPIDTGDHRTWTVPIAGITGDAELGITAGAGSGIQDLAGNALAASATSSPLVQMDHTAPTAVIALLDPPTTSLDAVRFSVEFSEPLNSPLAETGVGLTGTLSGGVAVSGSGTTFTVTVTLADPSQDGSIGIAVGSGAVTDVAGNAYAGGASSQYSIANWQGFTLEPVDAQKYTGDSHMFEITLAAPAGATYQWKWEDLFLAVHDGPATPDWTFAALSPTSQGRYWCEVTFDGTVYPSAQAILSVEDHLEIVQQPLGAAVNSGQAWTFSVVATGGYAPPQYQWMKDGVAIADATDASYTVASAQPSDEGAYSVEVQDANTDARTSDAAALSVSTASVPAAGIVATGLLLGLLVAASVRRFRGRSKTT